jgi:hypothetical protein
MEGEPCVLRKQPLRRLRSRLYRQLLSWIQRLEPTPLDPASQPAGADDRAGLILEAVGGREAGGAEQRRAEAEDGARLEGTRLDGAMPMPLPSVVPTGGVLAFSADRAALCPGQREPLNVEQAVLARDMTLLKREAADALAALGSAHALVTSARLAQVQQLRPLVEKGEVPGEALKALAADYQGWQNDQVRLFDALALVMRMEVPEGMVLDQVDPALQEQARQHLSSLAAEYQRRQLLYQIKRQG